MRENEACYMVSTEQFCLTKGYEKKTFQCLGNIDDNSPLDDLGRRDTVVVAIDAYKFLKNINVEFKEKFILRDLAKATIGF